MTILYPFFTGFDAAIIKVILQCVVEIFENKHLSFLILILEIQPWPYIWFYIIFEGRLEVEMFFFKGRNHSSRHKFLSWKPLSIVILDIVILDCWSLFCLRVRYHFQLQSKDICYVARTQNCKGMGMQSIKVIGDSRAIINHMVKKSKLGDNPLISILDWSKQ